MRLYIRQILLSRFPAEHRRREQRQLVLTISRVACRSYDSIRSIQIARVVCKYNTIDSAKIWSKKTKGERLFDKHTAIYIFHANNEITEITWPNWKRPKLSNPPSGSVLRSHDGALKSKRAPEVSIHMVFSSMSLLMLTKY